MGDRRLVYSTDTGRAGQERPPGRTAATPRGKPARPSPPLPDDGVVRIFRERGQRGGKPMTVIRGLRERGPQLDALALEFKRLCGAGGTVRDGAIELQGDHRDKVAQRLRALGHTVKLAGG